MIEKENGSKEFKPYSHSYWNPEIAEYEAMITEIGLISDSGLLLARVLLDGKVNSKNYTSEDGKSLGKYPVLSDDGNEYNPIIQSQSSTVVITWKIGIVSVGKGDIVTTKSDLTLDNVAVQLSLWLTDNYKITDTFGSKLDPDDLSGLIIVKLQDILKNEELSLSDLEDV